MTTQVSHLFEQLKAHYDEIVAIRRHLHKYPELSFEETNTSRFIAEQLRNLGVAVRERVGGNGVLGFIKGKNPGKTIGLRADFDALPIQEENDHEYVSTNPGVMHACGHDGHTASLLGVAKVLQENRHLLHGNVVLIHQHAEEKPPGGAKFMIEDGALDGVDYVFGAHLATELPIGTVASRKGAMMASVDHFKIKIFGSGGHGAKPHETLDSITVGSRLVTHLQQIVSRRVSPIEPAVVTVGKFHAGNAFNIIADTAEIEGTVRALNKEVREKIEQEIRALLEGMKIADHVDYELDYLHGYPVLVNHADEVELIERLVKENMPEVVYETKEPELGAEDFAYFLEHRPGAYFKVGARNDDPATHFPHHHPKFNFDEKALLIIGQVFLGIVEHYLMERGHE
ncbi:MAG: amidohydrolase [Bacilli bacterium]|nr:amidohydrolase [Bacilli bacterium]